MHLLLLVFLFPLSLLADPITGKLLEVKEHEGTLNIPTTQIGISGLIIRHFNDSHSAIIANAVVTGYDEASQRAHLKFSPYDGLKQNSLPSGIWSPQQGDEAVLAPHYSRALLIAPTDGIYHEMTSRLGSLQWVHPDEYAAYLSVQGHPTPTKNDFSEFCTATSAGLLYLYAKESLFTLDCRTMALLQITPAPLQREETKLPFYSRVAEIRAGWWGEGSEPLEAYDPYYLELMVTSNPKNTTLYEYIKTNQADLLPLFELKENP